MIVAPAWWLECCGRNVGCKSLEAASFALELWLDLGSSWGWCASISFFYQPVSHRFSIVRGFLLNITYSRTTRYWTEPEKVLDTDGVRAQSCLRWVVCVCAPHIQLQVLNSPDCPGWQGLTSLWIVSWKKCVIGSCGLVSGWEGGEGGGGTPS